MNGKRNLSAAGLALGLVVVVQGGCAGTAKVRQPTAQTAPGQQEAAKPAVKAAKPPELVLAGKVVETIDTGGYTYIALEKDGKKGWVALPLTQVAVGQEVRVRPGTEMGEFTSKTLNRTFDNILFSAGLVTEAGAKAPEGQLQLPPGHPGTDKKAAPQDMAAIKGTAGPEGQLQLPPGHPGTDGKGTSKGMASRTAASGSVEASGKLAGKVVETMDGGGYTYISLEKDGKKTWAAVPAMKVTVGEEIELLPGAAMKNFSSKSLNRTFESVIFSAGPVNK